MDSSAVTPSITLDLMALLLGLCVGSFLNVVALRSLAEESILWPPSKCPKCNGALGPLDNIPVLSYLVLRGRCRQCAAPIHWQYPVVEIITGLTFVAIERAFLDFPNSIFNTTYWNTLVDHLKNPQHAGTVNHIVTATSGDTWLWVAGMTYFACALIAVTVTDFREKLIPHEITYPSIIIGILFSAFVRHDLLGAMAGIGASYILFDFIAFYGLKVYLAIHGGMEEPVRERRLRRRLTPKRRRRLNRSLRWRLDLATIQRKQIDEEPLEVMGGGDAVLSALMSAFLGWQFLVVALIIGFIVGTLMGLALLVREMAKANLLHKCLRSVLIWGGGCATAFGTLGFLIDRSVGEGIPSVTASLATLGGAGGALLGVVSVGTRVSKPYPFGPALAIGGLICIFLTPNWLYLP